MAEVTCLELHKEDDDDDNELLPLDSESVCSHEIDAFASYPDFQPSNISVSIGSEVTSLHQIDTGHEAEFIAADDVFHQENQVNFVMDLFHQRVEQSSLDEGCDLLSPDPAFNSNPTDLELDLGLGFCMQEHCLGGGEGLDGDCNSGFMSADCSDDFFVWRRNSMSEHGSSSLPSDGAGKEVSDGLRVVKIESDLEEEIEVGGVELNSVHEDDAFDDERSVQICCDSFQLEDHRDDDNDFEWEEVDVEADEREMTSISFDVDVDENLDMSVFMGIPFQEELGIESEDTLRNWHWEVLLNVHNLDINIDGDPYLGDHDEHGMLIGQFAGNEVPSARKPPTSKVVVQNLPMVIVTKDDVDSDNVHCAVCKDDMGIGELAKQLPCSHRYHESCIELWLGMRNTCPVCRYELPTDDLEYERRSARAGHS